MTFGLTQAQYQILEELLIKPLQRNKAEVYVFGSRARGTQHPFSDIDILYKEGNGNEVAESEIGQIKEALEESKLPIKVDLVNDKYLAASYRPSVENDRILIKKVDL